MRPYRFYVFYIRFRFYYSGRYDFDISCDSIRNKPIYVYILFFRIQFSCLLSVNSIKHFKRSTHEYVWKTSVLLFEIFYSFIKIPDPSHCCSVLIFGIKVKWTNTDAYLSKCVPNSVIIILIFNLLNYSPYIWYRFETIYKLRFVTREQLGVTKWYRIIIVHAACTIFDVYVFSDNYTYIYTRVCVCMFKI